MIFISSFRNLDEDAEYLKNQVAAFASWQNAAEAIVYFNDPDPRMSSDITTFIPAPNWPTIKSMATLAAGIKGQWSCLINSDIVVSSDIVYVEEALRTANAKCATSYRWQFDPNNPMATKAVNDNGLDWFAGTSEYWAAVAAAIPEQYRIGHGMFDTWLIAFSNQNFKKEFFDATPSRCIFHPKHGGRRSHYTIDQTLLNSMGDASMPERKII